MGATVLAAWCTLRNDFRSFRVDRLLTYEPLDARMPKRRKSLFAQWRRAQAEHDAKTSDDVKLHGV